MKRIVIIFITVIFIIIFIGILYVLHTESGLQKLSRLINSSLPALSLQEVHGRLSGPLEITGLRYKADTTTVTIHKLSLDWKPSQLIRLRAYIAAFDADGIHIETGERKEAGPEEIKLPQIKMPLKLIIEKAEVRNITITQPGTDAPFKVRHVSLGARMNREILEIKHVHIDTSFLALNARGRISPQRDYPFDLTSDWKVQAEGYAPISGTSEIRGTLKLLDTRTRVISPVSAQLNITAYDLLSTLKWEGDAELEECDIRQINTTWPEIMISGVIKGTGDNQSAQITGTSDVFEKQSGHSALKFDVNADNETLTAREITAQIKGKETRAEFSGSYSFKESSFTIQGKWHSFVWPLIGEGVVRSPEGVLNVKGSSEHYRFTLKTSVESNAIPASTIVLKGSGTQSDIEIESLEVQLLDGVVKSRGKFEWKRIPRWEITMKGSALNPGKQWPDWQGKLDVNASVRGDMKNGTHHIKLDEGIVRGELRGYPFKADVTLEKKNNIYDLKSLEMKSGTAYVSASGLYSDIWDAKWNIKIPQLEELLPKGTGELYGEGTIQGNTKLPNVIAIMTGNGIALNAYRIDSLAVNIDIDTADARPSKIDITAENIKVEDHIIKKLTAQGEGTMLSHTVLLRAATEKEYANLSLDARYVDKQWKGLLSSGELNLADLGTWNLHESALVTISSNGAETEMLCWISGSSSLCMNAAWKQSQTITGGVRTSKMPLSLFKRLFPENVIIDGYIEGDATVAYEHQVLSGQVSLDVVEGSVSYTTDEEAQVMIPLGKTVLEARLDTKKLDVNLDTTLPERGFVRGTIHVPDFDPLSTEKGKQQLSGRFSAELKALDLVPVFTPMLRNMDGLMKADIQIKGTVSHPVFTGYLTLSNGRAELSDLGITLRDVTMNITGGETGALDFTGELFSGKGRLLIKGIMNIVPGEAPSAEIQIQGNNFEALKIPSARIVVSPDIQARFQKTRVDIKGSVTIPEAHVEPPDMSGAVAASRDVVIISDSGDAQKEDTLQVSGKFRVTLGEKVMFKGFGLSGRIIGGIDIVEQPGKTTQGTGEIQIVDGRYKAYGQDLTVEKGRLIFVGLLDDPGLDIRAVRQIRDVVSGVQVSGTLQWPELKVFSVPSMDESDALSYLLFGRPMGQLSGSEGNQLHSAALSAGLSGGGFIVKKIGARFGIEDIEIQKGTTPQEAALFLGKYLSPRLYLSYGIGLFEPVNTLRIRYHLSPSWLLQTEHGIESGGDILYKYEK